MTLRMTSRWLVGVGAALALSTGCYEGGQEEGKEPPPGYPGEWCLDTLTCAEAAWICDQDGLYCYDPSDPCEGVHCGWNGACVIGEGNKPSCVCNAGYSNDMYSLYCAGPGDPSAGSAT